MRRPAAALLGTLAGTVLLVGAKYSTASPAATAGNTVAAGDAGTAGDTTGDPSAGPSGSAGPLSQNPSVAPGPSGKTNFSAIHYSGATLTSNAYQASVRSAMTQAGI